MIYIPMALSFSIDSQLFMDVLNDIMDLFFVIDLLLNFHLAYYHKYSKFCIIKWKIRV